MKFRSTLSLSTLAIVGALTLVSLSAQAQKVLGAETSNGIVAPIPSLTHPGILVGSDGESSFDPFGFGHDTSDGIKFDNTDWTLVSGGSVWQQVASDPTAWVHPAINENEPASETVGHWVSSKLFDPSDTGVFTILDPNGNVGDIIKLYNNSQGANIQFTSDPFAVPEPSTLALLLGFGASGSLLAYRRRRR